MEIDPENKTTDGFDKSILFNNSCITNKTSNVI